MKKITKSFDSKSTLSETKQKSDKLLKGLDILRQYYALNSEGSGLAAELNDLVLEAYKRFPSRYELAIDQLSRELQQVETIIDKYHGDRSALIQILLDINAQHHWLPHEILRWVSFRLDVPLSQIYHIGSFYKVFSLVPQGRHIIQVCLGTACQVRGAPRLLDRVLEALKISKPGTDTEQKYTVTTVNCLGCCALGPVMVVDNDHYSNPSQEQIGQILGKYN